MTSNYTQPIHKYNTSVKKLPLELFKSEGKQISLFYNFIPLHWLVLFTRLISSLIQPLYIRLLFKIRSIRKHFSNGLKKLIHYSVQQKNR